MTVEFDPVRLDRRHGRHGAVVLAVVVLLFVGLAVLKPWDRTEDGTEGGSVASAAAPSLPPNPSASAFPPAAEEPAARWEHVAEAIQPHDDWGIQAFVDRRVIDGLTRPRAERLFERWAPATPVPGPAVAVAWRDGAVRDAVRLATSDEPVRVLGITSPSDERPLDVRFWWLRPGEPARWVDAPRVDPVAPGGDLLFLPPRRVDGTAKAWPPGSYRIDLLLVGRVARISLVLPASVAQPDPSDGSDPFASPSRPTERSISDAQADLDRLPPGPFVASDGVARSVDAPARALLAEDSAWLDAQPGRRWLQRTVAEVWAPDANGLGIRMPDGAQLTTVRLVRLTRASAAEERASPGVPQHTPGGTQVAIFRPPAGEQARWMPGSYAIEASWVERGRRRAGAWHVTLLPGPRPQAGGWAALIRAWASHAGSWGILAGHPGPRDDRGSGPVYHFPLEPRANEAEPAGLSPGCTGGAPLSLEHHVFGIAYPPGASPGPVRLEPLLEPMGAAVERVVTVRDVLPGLTLVGTPATREWPAGVYRLILGEGPRATLLPVCLGAVRPGRHVPNG